MSGTVYQGHCYYAKSVAVDWSTANTTTCEAPAHLVTITSAGEQAVVARPAPHARSLDRNASTGQLAGRPSRLSTGSRTSPSPTATGTRTATPTKNRTTPANACASALPTCGPTSRAPKRSPSFASTIERVPLKRIPRRVRLVLRFLPLVLPSCTSSVRVRGPVRVRSTAWRIAKALFRRLGYA